MGKAEPPTHHRSVICGPNLSTIIEESGSGSSSASSQPSSVPSDSGSLGQRSELFHHSQLSLAPQCDCTFSYYSRQVSWIYCIFYLFILFDCSKGEFLIDSINPFETQHVNFMLNFVGYPVYKMRKVDSPLPKIVSGRTLTFRGDSFASIKKLTEGGFATIYTAKVEDSVKALKVDSLHYS